MNRYILGVVGLAMIALVIYRIGGSGKQDSHKPDGIFEPVVWSGTPNPVGPFKPQKPTFHNGVGHYDNGGWQYP